MNNADKPAMPTSREPTQDEAYGYLQAQRPIPKTMNYAGLSKREHFAAMALQGMMSNTHAVENLSQNDMARESVSMADALLKALEAKAGES